MACLAIPSAQCESIKHILHASWLIIPIAGVACIARFVAIVANAGDESTVER
jgi:hypothetical protein